jgi:transcriptional regulator with XRE-family HTH domain
MSQLSVPKVLARKYQAGRLGAIDLAQRLGVSVQQVRRALRRQRTTVKNSEAFRAAFCRRVERANGLVPGTLYKHVTALYRQGKGQVAIADRLGIASRMVKLILDRSGVQTRPVYFRSAFFVNGVWQQKEAFAKALRALRTFRNLSQENLGKLVGICQGAVWSLEHARNGPHWRTALRLADALGVDPADLGLPDLPKAEMRRLARGKPSKRKAKSAKREANKKG